MKFETWLGWVGAIHFVRNHFVDFNGHFVEIGAIGKRAARPILHRFWLLSLLSIFPFFDYSDLQSTFPALPNFRAMNSLSVQVSLAFQHSLGKRRGYERFTFCQHC